MGFNVVQGCAFILVLLASSASRAQENRTEGRSSEEASTTVEYAMEQLETEPSQRNMSSEEEEAGGTTILYSGFFSPGQLEDPCSRECLPGAPPKFCRYHFKIERYSSMSKACYDCPNVTEDCFRADCIPADGLPRQVISVNRALPGPNIQVCVGDRVIVDVENGLVESSTSIHWHGQHMEGMPHMDGVPYVTQCPIAPGSTFRYSWTASQPGTHFWHSHTGWQRGDGALGGLIVKKPSEEEVHRHLYDLDLSTHVMVILDWSRLTGDDVFVSHHHARGSNKPYNILVNGRGVTPGHIPPPVFSVTKGFRYRFRLINGGALNCPIQLSIDNHTMTIISSDGYDIHPVEVDSLVSYAGERWDFVLEAEKEIGSYWMRWRGLVDCDERFNSVHQVSVLQYHGANHSQPSLPVSYQAANRLGMVVGETKLTEDSISIPELASVEEPPASFKKLPDRTLFLSFGFNNIDNPTYHKPQLYGFEQVGEKSMRRQTPQLNHMSLRLPPSPLLSQPGDFNPAMLCDHLDLEECKHTYCECTNIVPLRRGDLVEIILVDTGVSNNAIHPFHLHGHGFRVLGMDVLGNNVSVEQVKRLDAGGKLERNFHHPPSKDTVIVPNRGYTIIRFLATNPGYWLFHCHLQFHSENGMGLVFKVGEEYDFPPIPEGFPTCGDYLPEEVGNEIDFQDGKSIDNETSDSSSYEEKEEDEYRVIPLGRSMWRNSASQVSQPRLLVQFFGALVLFSHFV